MPDERRVVTVLFADVVSSTALAEAADAEDVRLLMGRYYGNAKRVVQEHGGTLEKFIGDAVMAIFGLPVAHGDDAERACSAALALREAIAGDPATASITLRIGVNTGEVVASRDTDAGDFLVTGDAVNLAARLQQNAEPGSILVGERTRTAVDEAFRFGDARAIALKGKADPVRASVLVGRSERTLHLGLAALHGLAADEFRSVAAHKFGQLAHGSSRLHRALGRVQTVLAITLARLTSNGWSGLNPVTWYLFAFDHAGKELWSRSITKDYGDFAFQWTFSASPLLYAGKLYVQVLQRDVPVHGRGRQLFVPRDLAVVVGVDVHEAGQHVRAVRAERAPRALLALADGDDAPGVDAHVPGEGRATRAVHDGAARDLEIDHVRTSPRYGWSRRSASGRRPR